MILTVFFLFVLYRETTGTVRVHVYVTTPMTCIEARKYCQTYHTDLSTITSEEDVQMVQIPAGGASELVQLADSGN